MARKLTRLELPPRDGTSQTARLQEALDSNYVSVDERRMEDLLDFARRYGKELRYYDLDNQNAGDWGAFIDPGLELEDIRAFLDGSAAVEVSVPETGKAERLQRPHFVLFLTFLKLLETLQGQLNTLTQRHLDFYFRQVLSIGRRPAVPDRATLLFELAPDINHALIPVGSLLSAGPDSGGTERLYATDRDLVVNRIEVARLSSLHVVRQEGWTTLHPMDDATNAHPSLPTEGVPSRWRTLGQASADRSDATSPPPPILGWAVGSPLLELSEGRRTIFLRLGFQPHSFNDQAIDELFREDLLGAESFLRIECSSEEGWLEPRCAHGALEMPGEGARGWEKLRTICFQIELEAEDPPLTALPQSSPNLPMVRLMLRQIWDAESGHYRTHEGPLGALRLVATHLRVEVSGLSRFFLECDGTNLEAERPFEPFGTSPAAGARLRLAHPELTDKPLDRLRLRLQWMGLPEDLSRHYKHYGLGTAPDGQPHFTIRIGWVDRRRVLPLVDHAPLFSILRAEDGTLATATEQTLEIPVPAAQIPRSRSSAQANSVDDPFLEGALQWELNSPDFQHQAYPTVASRQAVAMASALASREQERTLEPAEYEVNPPYTPKLQHLYLDYSCSSETWLDRAPEGDFSGLRMVHFHPWGFCELSAECPPLLPRYENEGELYIGLTGVHAPQTVSLLFQLAEGSGDPDQKPEELRWSYLSGNRWTGLEDGNILLDTTRGLINSGILELALEPTAPSTLLPDGYYWIRAALQRHSSAVCDTVAIHAQAVSATLIDRNNAPEHFGTPLEAESIAQFVVPIPEIANIRQPYTSHGGRRAEADHWFNTRVSERLRHKGRALSMWDYERLVLERFPEIYKAKCLPATPTLRRKMGAAPGGPSAGDRRAHDRGGVVVIVCPDVRNQLPFDPFEPKVRADLLVQIEQYLAARAPASATLEVRNAHYVAVRVNFSVRFKHLGNDGYYRTLLHEELNRYLSSWAYEEGADIVVGGKIYANSIVDFLDRRPYVDYIADLELLSSEDGENFRPASPGSPEQGYYVTTARPDGILLAARDHRIDLIPETSFEEEQLMGLHFMQVQLDLRVA